MSSQPEPDSYVLITGASSGIGRNVAISLSSRYRLILGGRDIERLQKTQSECRNEDWHHCWPFDLAEVSALAEALPFVLRMCGARVTGFVHCAAQFNVLPVRSISIDEALTTMNTNTLSAMEITRLLLRKDVNYKALVNIVFVSSIASKFGAKGFSSYCASKAALDGLMRALAVELGPRVRVNSVLPGAVRTAMTETMYADPTVADGLTRDYPLGTGRPSDISDAVTFLLSDQARWITGHEMVVDGGRSANIST